MKLTEICRISVNNLSANKMRTLLTVMGIAVGFATIVFLLSLGYGLQSLSIDKIASIEAIHTLDVSQGRTSVARINSELIGKIESFPGVEKVSPLLSVGLKVIQEGKSTDAVGNCVDDDFIALEGLKTNWGGWFANSKEDIVVSTALLKALDREPEQVLNKTLEATVIAGSKTEKRELKRTYKVIGIIQDDSTSFAYLPLASIEADLPAELEYSSLKVKADEDKLPKVKEEISALGFTVTTIADTIDQVYRVFGIIRLILGLFGLVALIVASIGMFNTMTIALLERTRDIGVMKALGVRDSDVSKIFLAESAVISSLGGTIGVSLGWGASKAVNSVINSLARSVGGEPQTLFVTPLFLVAAIIGFSILVGVMTGFYPSRRASKLNPLDALRYE